MSLNRALGELFKVIREEAASNPAFALKLEEALSVYRPSKALKQAARAKLKPKAPPVAGPAPLEEEAESAPLPHPAPPDVEPPALNPVAVFTREGEAGLRAALDGGDYSREALAAVVEEHNLDPAGAAAGADRDGLIEQIVAQAKRRVERDSKLFDY
jgi:hypothetical protein